MEMDEYYKFVAGKRRVHEAVGFSVDAGDLHSSLFPHQRDIVAWSLRLGRAAIFADTGLGKTRMQVEWARHVADHTGRRVLILAPLAVGAQTIAEGKEIGASIGRPGDDEQIHVTNYDRLHQIDPADYTGVVLDESSILKAYDGKTRIMLIESFADTPYRLACTATPAPNDHTELGNHAEFLGVCRRTEMLAEYFVHDATSSSRGGWRLKGHARREFWRWVSTWAVVIRRPSDLGHDDGGYELPPLTIENHIVRAEGVRQEGMLFAVAAQGLNEQRRVRRESMEDRCARVAEIVAASDSPALVWCELNDEADLITSLISDAVQVAGSDNHEVKEDRLLGFAEGRYRVLVTKPKIAGFGMNWQICNRVIFAGLTHSYEQYYQAVRRCWRFGQDKPVTVHMVQSSADGAIAQNLSRKAKAADQMAESMLELIREYQIESIRGERPGFYSNADRAVVAPSWL